jgi:hypothetical protein
MFLEMLLNGLEVIVASVHDFMFEPEQEKLGFEGSREWFIKDDVNA